MIQIEGVKPALEKLGIDIIIQILSFVQPLDIIALRQVCRALLAASRERVVWRNALRLVTVQHGLFAATFPVGEMTIPQLQRAATSPGRFVAFLRRELRPPKIRLPNKCIEPTSIRELPGKFENAFLVPGGRYILAKARNFKTIELWDIGFSANSVIPSSPVTFKRFKKYIAIIDLQPIAAGDGLLVMVEVNR
jgi:F-box domain